MSFVPGKYPRGRYSGSSGSSPRLSLVLVFLSAATFCSAGAEGAPRESVPDLLSPPRVGACQLRILAPTVLELALITTEKPAAQRPSQWDFVADGGRLTLPHTNDFLVTAGGRVVPVREIGFRRRVVYAPLKERDLRIGNYLYLRLTGPIADSEAVEVKNPGGKL